MDWGAVGVVATLFAVIGLFLVAPPAPTGLKPMITLTNLPPPQSRSTTTSLAATITASLSAATPVITTATQTTPTITVTMSCVSPATCTGTSGPVTYCVCMGDATRTLCMGVMPDECHTGEIITTATITNYLHKDASGFYFPKPCSVDETCIETITYLDFTTGGYESWANDHIDKLVTVRVSLASTPFTVLEVLA